MWESSRDPATVVLLLGPARSGKTTVLRALAGKREPVVLPVPGVPGAVVETVATTGPGGAPVRLVSAPGRLLCSTQRRRLLTAADGVLFVVDARAGRREANLVHLDELGRHLLDLQRDPADFPLVLLLNRLDDPAAVPAASLPRVLSVEGLPSVAVRADRGLGVAAALAALWQRLPQPV